MSNTRSRINAGPCICKEVIFGYEIEIVVLNTYFSDHAVRVKISKKEIDFTITWLKMMKNAIHLEYVQTIQLPHHIERMNFLDHTFVFVVEVVIKIFAYLMKM